MGKKGLSKRSQSEIITTVLIILLVIVAVFIVYVAVRNIIKSGTEQADISSLDVSLTTSSTSLSQSLVDISVSRKAGAGNISEIRIILKDSAGKSICTYSNRTAIPKELETVVYTISCSGASSYEVYPIIHSGGKEVIGMKATRVGSGSFDVPPIIGNVIEIDSCDVPGLPNKINQSNTVFRLKNDVSSAGTCFTINYNNVALDGNNKVIIYNAPVDNYYGIYASGVNNLTISNITVTGFDDGISLTSSSNNTLFNINSSLNTNHGLTLDSSSNNTLSSITANNNKYYGLYLYSSSNNKLSSITANSNTYGLYLYSSSNNKLSSITANTNTNSGLFLSLGSNNTISNVTANTNRLGLYIYSSSNNTISNVTANTNTNLGLFLYLSSNNNNLTKVYSCANGGKDFNCSSSLTGTIGSGNTFGAGKIEACLDGWPVLGVNYAVCP